MDEIERPTQEAEPARPCCDGCGASAPETNTDYTLISRSFGWRLMRRKLPNGGLAMEWRCASCWKKYKGERAVLSGLGLDPVDSDHPRPASPARRTPPPVPFRRHVKIVGIR